MYLNCQNKLILFCADIDTFFDSKKDDLIIEVTDDGTSTSSDQVSEFPVCKVVSLLLTWKIFVTDNFCLEGHKRKPHVYVRN